MHEMQDVDECSNEATDECHETSDCVDSDYSLSQDWLNSSMSIEVKNEQIQEMHKQQLKEHIQSTNYNFEELICLLRDQFPDTENVIPVKIIDKIETLYN